MPCAWEVTQFFTSTLSIYNSKEELNTETPSLHKKKGWSGENITTKDRQEKEHDGEDVIHGLLGISLNKMEIRFF